jgi:hypothetical protein
MSKCEKLREHWNMASCNKERCPDFGYCVRMINDLTGPISDLEAMGDMR